MFYQFVSFLTPGIIYRCDVTTDSYRPQVSGDFIGLQGKGGKVFFPMLLKGAHPREGTLF